MLQLCYSTRRGRVLCISLSLSIFILLNVSFLLTSTRRASFSIFLCFSSIFLYFYLFYSVLRIFSLLSLFSFPSVLLFPLPPSPRVFPRVFPLSPPDRDARSFFFLLPSSPSLGRRRRGSRSLGTSRQGPAQGVWPPITLVTVTANVFFRRVTLLL